MWIVSDNTMSKILGGDYKDVIGLKKEDNQISIRRLSRLQSTYKSYQGFRKFYCSLLKSIIDGVFHVEDNTIKAKVIRFISK